MVAAEKGHEEVVRLLLGREDVNPGILHYPTDWTALTFAAKRGHDAVVGLLLERDSGDPKSKDKALKMAAMGGHESVIRRIDPNRLSSALLLQALKNGDD